MSEIFPPEQNHAFTVIPVITETGNGIVCLLLTTQERGVEITEYQQSGKKLAAQ